VYSDRRHEDDGCTVVEVEQRLLNSEEHALEVQFGHRCERMLVDLSKGLDAARSNCPTGVHDQNIEFANGLLGAPEHPFELVELCDVALQSDEVVAQ